MQRLPGHASTTGLAVFKRLQMCGFRLSRLALQMNGFLSSSRSEQRRRLVTSHGWTGVEVFQHSFFRAAAATNA